MSNPFPRGYWRDRLKAGKFPDIAFGAFPFYDTLNYGIACIRLLGSYIDRGWIGVENHVWNKNSSA
jgi:hypothetical protein